MANMALISFGKLRYLLKGEAIHRSKFYMYDKIMRGIPCLQILLKISRHHWKEKKYHAFIFCFLSFVTDIDRVLPSIYMFAYVTEYT